MEATPGGGGIDATTETSGAGAGFGATGATDGAADPGGLLPPPSSLPENKDISKTLETCYPVKTLLPTNYVLHFDPSTVEDL